MKTNATIIIKSWDGDNLFPDSYNADTPKVHAIIIKDIKRHLRKLHPGLPRKLDELIKFQADNEGSYWKAVYNLTQIFHTFMRRPWHFEYLESRYDNDGIDDGIFVLSKRISLGQTNICKDKWEDERIIVNNGLIGNFKTFEKLEVDSK
jgi:hypothetical protein